MDTPIIKVKNLKKTFYQDKRAVGLAGSFKSLFHREKIAIHAVNDISFEIQEGEFAGFLGPNGAGKTTTLKMLSGILHPTWGDMQVLGFSPWERKKNFQKQFSLVMGQKNQMWWDLPVIESFEFNKAIYEVPDDIYEKQKSKLSSLLGIEHLLGVQARKLSLGERMKCELAAALLHKPKVLFLDEPTIGLDVVSQKNIREFLLDYNQTEKATIILTSHYMEDIRRLCERVIIIDHGAIIYNGDYRTLIEEEADTKDIEVIFSENVDRKDIESYGAVSDYRVNACRLTVPRSQITQITTRLLEKLPIDDISIHEKTMEEIVSDIFQKD